MEGQNQLQLRCISLFAWLLVRLPPVPTPAHSLFLRPYCHANIGETVALFLSHRSISPNAIYPLGSGTTALHLAASIGRADIVSLLLEQPEIDDTLKDASGKTCKDVAKGKPVLSAIKGTSFITFVALYDGD